MHFCVNGRALNATSKIYLNKLSYSLSNTKTVMTRRFLSCSTESDWFWAFVDQMSVKWSHVAVSDFHWFFWWRITNKNRSQESILARRCRCILFHHSVKYSWRIHHQVYTDYLQIYRCFLWLVLRSPQRSKTRWGASCCRSSWPFYHPMWSIFF